MAVALAIQFEVALVITRGADSPAYFELDGKRYCHIIDPRTGYPVQDMQAVTVLVPPEKNSGVISDVASKPIFIADADNKPAAISAMGIKHVMMIDRHGHVSVSKALADRIKWVGNVAPSVF
jgi:thiamine biosynthesis lipoprotein